MRERWKKIKRVLLVKDEDLGPAQRKAFLAVNLVLIALFLWMTWIALGCPLPTAELEFRRMERTHLLPASEIQGKFQTPEQREVIIGTQKDLVVLYDGTDLYRWPRERTGATLLPVWEGVRSIQLQEIRFAAVDVPEGTHSAVLEAAISCWYSGRHGSGFHISAEENAEEEGKAWSRDYRAEGELLKDGGVLFRLAAQEEDEYDDGFIEKSLFLSLTMWNTYQQSAAVRGVNWHMEAVFYDEGGAELGRAVLRSLEGGKSDAA